MSNIVPFNFEGNDVRGFDRDGEPWFVLADVCRVLEVGNPSMAASRLDDDERGISTVDTPSGVQDMVVINESGLYSLILTSRKPAAKRFKKWVTSEVLPALRKTGRYEIPQSLADAAHHVANLAHMTPREINSHIGYLREIRLTFGEKVSGAQYPATTLPALAGAGGGRGAEPPPPPPELDGIACLHHLMDGELSPRIKMTIGQLAQVARRCARTREQLGAAGVFVDPTNWKGFVAIATGHPQLQRVFTMTDWAPDWAAALLTLRGARKPPNAILFPDRQRRAVLVPWEAVEAATGQ